LDLETAYHAAISYEGDVAGVEAVLEFGDLVGNGTGVTGVAGKGFDGDGEPWRKQLIAYLKSNRDELVRFITEECDGLSIHTPEATYLAWIDAQKLGVENPADFFEKQAGLFLSDGTFFGWPGYVRFNFGCPRARMQEGLEKMKASIMRRG
jgi:cysteine-S-conjugate beta-lyase